MARPGGARPRQSPKRAAAGYLRLPGGAGPSFGILDARETCDSKKGGSIRRALPSTGAATPFGAQTVEVGSPVATKSHARTATVSAASGRTASTASAVVNLCHSEVDCGELAGFADSGLGVAEDLWEYVWERVEGLRATTASLSSSVARSFNPPEWKPARVWTTPPPRDPTLHEKASRPEDTLPLVPVTKRRRILGKHAPELAIVVYKKRLSWKQPPSYFVHGEPTSKSTTATRGHYDTLGVGRSATAGEISAAYRRKALETHPDKGGDPADFCRVVAAFEELADERRRAAYDRTLVLFGRKDGNKEVASPPKTATPPGRRSTCGKPSEQAASVSECQPSLQHYGLTRITLIRLLASKPETWPKQLAVLQDGTLALLRELASTVAETTARGVASSASDWAIQRDTFDQNPANSAMHSGCITRHKNGLRVVVTWAALSVSTGFTKSLAQAVDWQVALLWVRGIAQARLRHNGRRHGAVAMSATAKLGRVTSAPSISWAMPQRRDQGTPPRGRRNTAAQLVVSKFLTSPSTALSFQTPPKKVCVESASRADSGEHDSNDAADPLTELEWAQLLEAEPSLELLFTAVVELCGSRGQKKVKVSGPPVQDLRTALGFRRRFLAAAAVPRKFEEALRKEKRDADKEATQFKRSQRGNERRLLAAVTKELNCRISAGNRHVQAPGRRGQRTAGVTSTSASKKRRADVSTDVLVAETALVPNGRSLIIPHSLIIHREMETT
eukprot:TRINITY_DN22382_c0_g1_i2.p1 TRINITY_DN22382_c0_g1~~TRINITY_DN22382_c0_g1_i2.p1  ORF type:complete len:733 (+),score=106.79 TRINITY_DN22382_c0_g1_i2:53-2251(+)